MSRAREIERAAARRERAAETVAIAKDERDRAFAVLERLEREREQRFRAALRRISTAPPVTELELTDWIDGLRADIEMRCAGRAA